MTEKVLKNKKNGMAMLLLFILLYLGALALVILSAVQLDDGRIGFLGLLIPGILWLMIGWVPFLGLKVLKPQEALVLTLFGKYVGSLKEEGFYFVNPFCVAVNPAAKTRLNQSGDVDGGNNSNALLNVALGKSVDVNTAELMSKKISLKDMTLSNSRQKINDCLGNPVEIGIAVIWRVTDTAKAVFNVDNYKEYLSLQCDSALRNIVRLYPYDVAPGVDRRRGQPARFERDGGAAHPRRDPAEGHQSRYRDRRGPHHLSGVRPGDRRRHAAAPAGQRHH